MTGKLTDERSVQKMLHTRVKIKDKRWRGDEELA
jgi:hypothetical protein